MTDLKPDNVLLQVDDDEGEQAKIVDFGIAKILASPDGKNGLIKTDVHANLGTALYMAPERFGGAPGDPRLDVYALGLLLHELVTGLLPFATRYEDRETPTVLLHKRLTMAIPPLASPQVLSPQLVMLHADLLDRDPMRRPAHAGEVRQRLRDIPEAASLHISLDLGTKVTPSSPENRAIDSSILSLDKYGPAGRGMLSPDKAGSVSGPSLAPVRTSLPQAQRSLPPGAHSIPPVGRSIPPVGRSIPPVRRSLSPVGSAETAPQYSSSGRSLPPQGTSGTSLGAGPGSSSDGYARFSGAINPEKNASGRPANPSLPPGAMSLPPGAVSIPPAAMSMNSKSEGLLLESMRSLHSGGSAPSTSGSAVTKWLLAGCLVLIVLLVLLALS